MKSSMGYTSIKTAQNPCISQTILFANAIQTPKCVSMIPNSSEHIYFYLIMTHSWHTYKSTVLISCNAIATADILPSIVMYPPKINRKNYCTVQCHRKPLGPKMTYHNVLPESRTLFPRFALIFNILIKRTTCARIKSFGFLFCSDRVRLYVRRGAPWCCPPGILFSSYNCQWLKKNYCRWRVCAMYGTVTDTYCMYVTLCT